MKGRRSAPTSRKGEKGVEEGERRHPSRTARPPTDRRPSASKKEGRPSKDLYVRGMPMGLWGGGGLWFVGGFGLVWGFGVCGFLVFFCLWGVVLLVGGGFLFFV